MRNTERNPTIASDIIEEAASVLTNPRFGNMSLKMSNPTYSYAEAKEFTRKKLFAEINAKTTLLEIVREKLKSGISEEEREQLQRLEKITSRELITLQSLISEEEYKQPVETINYTSGLKGIVIRDLVNGNLALLRISDNVYAKNLLHKLDKKQLMLMNAYLSSLSRTNMPLDPYYQDLRLCLTEHKTIDELTRILDNMNTLSIDNEHRPKPQ